MIIIFTLTLETIKFYLLTLIVLLNYGAEIKKNGMSALENDD